MRADHLTTAQQLTKLSDRDGGMCRVHLILRSSHEQWPRHPHYDEDVEGIRSRDFNKLLVLVAHLQKYLSQSKYIFNR